MKKQTIPTTKDGRVARRLMPPKGLGITLSSNGRPVGSKGATEQVLLGGYVRAVVPYTQAELKASGRAFGGHVQVLKRSKTI